MSVVDFRTNVEKRVILMLLDRPVLLDSARDYLVEMSL
jgi:hypothetical protein